MRATWVLVVGVAVGPGQSLAQHVVSARAGTVHQVEGRAFLNDQPLRIEPGHFPQMEEGASLRTELGRVELLLTPGSIARLGEFSTLRLLSSDLADTRVELLEGTVTLEVMELLKHNSVTLQWKHSRISIEKPGLYELLADPPRLRVYKGAARLLANDQQLEIKGGRSVDLGATQLAVAKFDAKKDTDSLYRWSVRRSRYLAMANLSAAKSLYDRGLSWERSGWYWNPWFGLWTFIPARGVLYSPFGYSFWSPYRVVNVYVPARPQPSWDAGGGGWGRYSADRGYVVVTGRSAASSTATVPAGPAASAPSASPRSAGTSSPRVGGGRGR